jgi:hypothetical protein
MKQVKQAKEIGAVRRLKETAGEAEILQQVCAKMGFKTGKFNKYASKGGGCIAEIKANYRFGEVLDTLKQAVKDIPDFNIDIMYADKKGESIFVGLNFGGKAVQLEFCCAWQAVLGITL